MEKTVSELLADLKLAPEAIAVIVLGLIVIPLLSRGLFALITSHHSRRKDAIELWVRPEVAKNTLALESLVRLGYGVWLPAPTIRRIEIMDFPSRVLLDLQKMMPCLEPHGSKGALKVRPRFLQPARRWVDITFYVSAYIIASTIVVAMIGFAGTWVNAVPTSVRLTLGILLGVTAYYSLETGATLYKLPRFIDRYPALFDTAESPAITSPESIAGEGTAHSTNSIDRTPTPTPLNS